MATPFELFETDFPLAVGFRQMIRLVSTETGLPLESGQEIHTRLLIDFAEGVQFVSIFVPSVGVADIALHRLPDLVSQAQNLQSVTTWDIPKTSEWSDCKFTTGGNETEIWVKEIGGAPIDQHSIPFMGRVIVYGNFDVPDDEMLLFVQRMRERGLNVIFRGMTFAMHQFVPTAPRAFISHASADKDHLARPLAAELRRRNVNVWYDEYSLHPGDSLQDSIEAGLQNCGKCIFVLTPNFLNKGGWTKAEYQAVFTRERLRDERIMIPVWSDVTVDEVFAYSPLLADRVAAPFAGDISELCDRLMPSLFPEIPFVGPPK